MALSSSRSRTVDMTGKVFGKLTCVNVSKVDQGGNAHWNCLCECGDTISVVGGSLRNGQVTACKECRPMYGNINDLTGKTFSDWTVLSLDKNNEKEGAYWLCVCTCGEFRCVLGQNLVSKKTLSCGHTPVALTHGMSGTKIYNVWAAMKERCSNPNHQNYMHYGGRGICVDESWGNFDNFYRDMGETHREDLVLDRIDNNKGYSKENCRWTTYSISVFNTRLRKDNTSGRTGVYRYRDKYFAAIFHKGKKIILGYFDKFEDACRAREEAEIEYFGQIKNYVI